MTKTPVRGPFGGAKNTAVEAVSHEGANAISVAPAGSKAAFLDSWIKLLAAFARRLRASGALLSAPVMLVYVDDCGEFASERQWKSNPLLGIAPTDDLAGILAAGTGEFGACLNPTRLIETADFMEHIQNVELENELTISLMDANTLYIWPDGVNGAIRPQIRLLTDGQMQIDGEKVEQELDLFYTEEARDRTKWWRNPDERITVNQPERAVQETLRMFLLGRFAEYAKVREEIASGNGRTDITIQATNGIDYSAVLELKTTRDVRTPKRAENKPITIPLNTNVRWAKSGIQQAAAYRDRERFKDAFLCLYDFCEKQGSQVESHIGVPAALYNVRVKRYWISSSHEELRERLYPV